MTKLGESKVAREFHQRGMRKPVVVELDGTTGNIRMREKGSRISYTIPIMTVFYHAVRLSSGKA